MNPTGNESGSFQNTHPDSIVVQPEIFKPVLNEAKTKTSTSVISLVLFAVIGYFAWHSNIRALVIITTVILIHELGHLLAMKLFNYSNLGIFFIPLFGGAAKGTKTNISQKQESIVLLAGPLPGIMIGSVLFMLYKSSMYDPWMYGFSIGFFFINLINLLPIYPLDGGRLLKIIFLNNSKILSNIFTGLSIVAIIYFSITRKDYIFLFFGFMLLISLINTIQKQKLLKLLKEEGIEPDMTFGQMNKEQYTHIRQRMVQHITAYKKYDLFEFDINSEKERTLAKDIEQLFKAAPVNDMNLYQKILIIGIWVSAFVLPFIIHLPIPFNNR
ncbi:MAG: site-2 protease family protein [Ferruginibacter sp.]